MKFMKNQSYPAGTKRIVLVFAFLLCSAGNLRADIQAPNAPASPVKDHTPQSCGYTRYYYNLSSIPVMPFVDSVPNPDMLVKWYLQVTETGTDQSNPIDSTHLELMLAPGTYYSLSGRIVQN
jgi:hypothetical protein